MIYWSPGSSADGSGGRRHATCRVFVVFADTRPANTFPASVLLLQQDLHRYWAAGRGNAGSDVRGETTERRNEAISLQTTPEN